MITLKDIPNLSVTDPIPESLISKLPDHNITVKDQHALQFAVEARAFYIIKEILTLCHVSTWGPFGFSNGEAHYEDECVDGWFNLERYSETVKFYGSLDYGKTYENWITNFEYVNPISFPTKFISMPDHEWRSIVERDIKEAEALYQTKRAKQKQSAALRKEKNAKKLETIMANLTEEAIQVISLSATEFKKLQKLMKNPPAPNKKLKGAAKTYKNLKQNQFKDRV